MFPDAVFPFIVHPARRFVTFCPRPRKRDGCRKAEERRAAKSILCSTPFLAAKTESEELALILLVLLILFALLIFALLILLVLILLPVLLVLILILILLLVLVLILILLGHVDNLPYTICVFPAGEKPRT